MSLLDLLVAVVAGVAGIAGLVAILRWPRAALASCCFLLLLATTKFRSRDAQAALSGSVDAQVLFELLLYAVVLVIVLRNFLLLRPSTIRVTWVEGLLGGYVGLALLSVLWAPNLNITVVRATQLVILFLFAAVAVRIFAPERLLKVLVGSVTGYVLLFSSIALTVPGAAGRTMNSAGYPRFSWYSVHPLQVAVYAGSGFVFLLALTLFSDARARRALPRVATGALAAVLLVVLIATHSRGATLAVMLGTSALLARKYLVGEGAQRSKLAVFMMLLWTGSFIMLLAQQLAGWGTGESRLSRFLLRGGSVDQLATLNGRSEILEAVLGLFAHRPLAGHGYLASRGVLLEQIHWAGHTHMVFAEALLNLGIAGVALLLIPFGYTLLGSLRSALSAAPGEQWFPSAVLGATVFLFGNSFVSPGFAGTPDFEVLLFFALCLAYSHRRAAHHAAAVDRRVGAVAVSYPGRRSLPSLHPAGRGIPIR